MRSKTLHRDEDMILDTLRSKLVYYHSTLLAHFKSCDPEQTGYVDSNTFSVSSSRIHRLSGKSLSLIFCTVRATMNIHVALLISRLPNHFNMAQIASLVPRPSRVFLMLHAETLKTQEGLGTRPQIATLKRLEEPGRKGILQQLV